MLPKTIVLHYKKLADRKQNIIKQLDQHKFDNYSFYENYDQDELTLDIINQLYEPKIANLDKWINKVSLWGPEALNYHNPQLNIAEISVTIKFGKVFQQLAQETFNYCIIFEDDVILCNNFESKFYDYLRRTPNDWDAIYFGSCVNLHSANISQNKTVYLKENPSSRGGPSTLLKYKTVVDLAETWFPFNLISDWELAAQHYLHDHKVYWWEPPLTVQGSEIGLFKSTLR